jgi:hypothetical protein
LFDALVHPNSNIIRNLKYFTLTKSNESLDFAKDQRDMYILLMLALPRDKVVRFESFVRFDSNAFKILVQAQRQLEDIDVPLGNAVQDTTSLVPYLTAVNDITVWIDRDAARAASTFQNYESLLQHTLRLASMAIVASRADGPQMPGYDADISLIEFPQVNNKIGRLDLRDLELVDLLLGSHYVRITDYINLDTLSSLHLFDCLDLEPIIHGLTDIFSTNSSSLKYLSICLPDELSASTSQSSISHDIELLLLSFNGLRYLLLSMSTLALVSKESIINHAETLTFLAISSEHTSSAQYGVADITAVLNACTNLAELGIAIGIPSCSWVTLCRTVLVDDSVDPSSSAFLVVQKILVRCFLLKHRFFLSSLEILLT